MATAKKKKTISIGKMQKNWNPCALLVGIKMVQSLWKTIWWAASQKLKNGMIVMVHQFHFWVCIQKKWKQGLKQVFVHSSTAHSNQKGTATSVHRGWMDKQDMEYTCNEILFSLKNEGNSDKWNDMDDSGGYYTDWNKPVTKKCDFTYVRFPESANS